MADSVKNVTFRFKADTSQIMRIIDDLNKAIAKTQNSLSTFRIAGDAKQIKQQLDSINKKLEIQADTRQARRELNELNKEIVRIQKQPAGGGTGFLDTLKGGLAAFGIVATADALVDLGKSTIQAAVDFEKLTASFRALIGDKERADQAIKDIQQFALQTPFDVTQIAAAGKTLLGYGISVEDLIPTLKQLGDVSAASGGDIQRVALAFGQVAAKGKLQGEEIRQLVNVGFNPLQEISKATGETMAALAKRVEEGKVSFEEVAEAFRTATSEGGRFFELAATLNNTLGGQLQKLGEQFNLFKIQVGTIAGDDLRPFVEELTKLFNKLTEFTQYLRENAVALGVIKGVIGFIVIQILKLTNAFYLNTIAVKSWSSIVSFSTGLLSKLKNGFAFVSKEITNNTKQVGTNTFAQKANVAQLTIVNTTQKLVSASASILSKAMSSLWATIKANPLGVLILAYEVLNGLLDANTKKTREAWLEQMNYKDGKKIVIDNEQKAAGAIKAVQGSLDDQLKSIETVARQYGFLDQKVKELVNELAEQQNVNVESIQNTKDYAKWLRELRDLFQQIKQREALEINVQNTKNTLEELRMELGKVESDFLNFQDARQKALEEASKQVAPEFGAFGTATGTTKPITQPIVLAEAQRQNVKQYVDEINSLLIKIEEARLKLEKEEEQLYGFGIGKGGKGKNAIKNKIDALEALRNAYIKLTDDITDSLLKLREQEINVLPEDTEEQQVQKAFKSLQIQRDANAAAQNEEQKNQEALLAEAIAGGANIQEATELFNRNLEVIRRKYNIKDENLLIAHNQKLYDIAQFWIDKNDKLIEEGRKAQSDELLRQLQRREQGFGELQSDIEERFLKAAPGGAKGLRQRFKDITAAIQDNLQEQLKIRKDERLREFNQERKDIDKLYTLRIQDIKGDDPQRKQKLKDYFEQRNEAMKTAGIKFNNDIKIMEQETADAQFDIGKANQEKLEQLEKERKLFIIDQIQQTIDFSIQAAQQIIDIEQRKNDELIAMQEERVQKAREIADKGNASLLEAEEKRLTELQKKRAKFVRQQQALIYAQTVAEATLAIARAAAEGGGWASAITIASVVASLIAGYISARSASQSAIGGFAEGGWTGKGGKYEPAGVVHREEFVVKKGPAEKYRPLLEQMNRGRDPLLAKGMGQQVIMINNVGMEERLARIEKAITGQDRMQLTIDESGIHGIVSHYQWKNNRLNHRLK